MTTRKVKQAIKTRNEGREYTGFLSLENKKARDKRCNSMNIAQRSNPNWIYNNPRG